MSDRKYSDRELLEIIEDEGHLEYAVRHVCDSRHISDPETGRLWDEAAVALNKLAERIGYDR